METDFLEMALLDNGLVSARFKRAKASERFLSNCEDFAGLTAWKRRGS